MYFGHAVQQILAPSIIQTNHLYCGNPINTLPSVYNTARVPTSP